MYCGLCTAETVYPRCEMTDRVPIPCIKTSESKSNHSMVKISIVGDIFYTTYVVIGVRGVPWTSSTVDADNMKIGTTAITHVSIGLYT